MAFWLVMFLMSLIWQELFADPYPIYEANGTYYEVGVQIGQQASNRISKFINMNPDMDTMRSYINTTQGGREFAELIEYNQQYYSNYFEELRGLAHGSGLNYEDILLISFEYELDALMAMNNYSETHLIDSCSDLLIFNGNTFVGHGHNEDDWNGSLTTAYFTNITYKNNGKANNIFGFNFIPGILPSTSSPAISLTNSITLTINYLFPYVVTSYGRATAFICRSILESNNINEAINKITNYGGNVSVGASFNIGQYDEKNDKFELVNVENYMDKYSVLHIDNHNYTYHFNTYQRIEGIVQMEFIMPSSNNRMNRTIQMINDDFNGTLTEKEQIVEILGDTQNQQYPIWRTGYISTLITSLYDLENGKAYFYEQCDPKNCTPSITVEL
eukprot:217177_1